MPSKTSKSSRRAPSPWTAEPACSEALLLTTARRLARELGAGDRVLLEGPMGAGKTTFARALLEGLGVAQPPEGSPSFAIAHEYRGAKAEVIHLDLYRIRSESEIDEAGIPAYFWERSAVVIAEWLSLFPGFEAEVRRTGRCWRVELGFSDENENLRALRITPPLPARGAK